MKQPRLVIWDFDGVVCDSLIECITVTKVAATFIERPEFAVTDKNLHEICHADVIMPLYERMRHLRPFIVKGQDYLWQYFNLQAFSSAQANGADYNAIYSSMYAHDRDMQYELAFYEARKLVQSLMRQQYFTLFRPFAGALYALRTALVRYRNYVCTARDQRGVLLLLGDNGIDFPREKIFSKDFNGLIENREQGKTEQILDILKREGGSDQGFLLIEDQVKAPAELKDVCHNMEVIFAAYGYGLEDDWSTAGIVNCRTVRTPDALAQHIY